MTNFQTNQNRLSTLQKEADQLMTQLLWHLESPSKAAFIRKKLDKVIYQIHSINSLIS